jgi:hypothetical protein
MIFICYIASWGRRRASENRVEIIVRWLTISLFLRLSTYS